MNEHQSKSFYEMAKDNIATSMKNQRYFNREEDEMSEKNQRYFNREEDEMSEGSTLSIDDSEFAVPKPVKKQKKIKNETETKPSTSTGAKQENVMGTSKPRPDTPVPNEMVEEEKNKLALVLKIKRLLAPEDQPSKKKDKFNEEETVIEVLNVTADLRMEIKRRGSRICCALRVIGDDHIPTGKFVTLDPSAFTLLKTVLGDTIIERNDIINGKEAYVKYYVGNRVFVIIQDPFWLVDIRCYFRTKLHNNLRPTRNGFKVKFVDVDQLMAKMGYIKEKYHEFRTARPCVLSHHNFKEMKKCSDCAFEYDHVPTAEVMNEMNII